MMEYLLYLLCGVFAGVLAGLLGLGGGIIVVPTLILLFDHQHIFPPEFAVHAAIGTSLTVMIFTSLSSSFAYARRKLIIWPLFYKFIPGMLLGVLFGSYIAHYLSSDWLRIGFACFMLLIAVQMFLSKPAKMRREIPGLIGLSVPAASIGMLSGFFGVGGGSMMVPYFTYCQVEMHKATGTSAACGFIVAIFGAICFMGASMPTAIPENLPAGTIGYVYWPAALLIAPTSLVFAPLGTRLAVGLSSRILKRIFAIVLVVTAANLLLN